MELYEFLRGNQSKYELPETRALIAETARKMCKYFSEYENIMISVSGGSDSDCIVHLVCAYFPEFLQKIRFVFVDTGLEFEATKRHLCDLETRYNISIEQIRGVSVVTACKKYGFPILNKTKAKGLSLYLRGTPKGEYIVFERPGTMYAFSENERKLARYLKNNGIMVSSKCCDVSKKSPIHAYIRKYEIDLNVTGIRKAEGGARKTAYNSCYKIGKPSSYMPLFYWSDAIKADFKRAEGIKYSDCYEVYGMRRTGCVGCPFGRDTAQELQAMRKFEPKLFLAVLSVFGKAYELTDKFHCRAKKKMPEFEEIEMEELK